VIRIHSKHSRFRHAARRSFTFREQVIRILIRNEKVRGSNPLGSTILKAFDTM
jgi:hypothetical protein